jgi:hypothetical protein
MIGTNPQPETPDAIAPASCAQTDRFGAGMNIIDE